MTRTNGTIRTQTPTPAQARTRNARRFATGSGCYTCTSCTRKTRSTGRGDNELVEVCAECYELGMVENEISDCGETPELLAEAEELRAAIVAKGGKLPEE